MKPTKLLFIALGAALSIAACKKSSNNPVSNVPIMETSHDTMSAQVNGSQWVAWYTSNGLVTIGSAGVLEIGGVDTSNTKNINITLNSYLNQPKDYTITVGGKDSASYVLDGAWHHASGSVKIVYVTDSAIQGTFTLTADSFTVTNGVFNYKL